MAEREYSVIVPVEVRVTRHDDGAITVQWLDFDDDTRTVAYGVEEAERISTTADGSLLEAGEAAVKAAITAYARA